MTTTKNANRNNFWKISQLKHNCGLSEVGEGDQAPYPIVSSWVSNVHVAKLDSILGGCSWTKLGTYVREITSIK